MKRVMPFLLSVMLLSVALTTPITAASQELCQAVEVEKFGDTTVETILTVYNTISINSARTVSKTKNYYSGSTLIATVTLNATFGYDGITAWVKSSSSSHTTFNGWNYSGETITPLGNSVSLSALLSKFPYASIPVDISLTCSPTGTVS